MRKKHSTAVFCLLYVALAALMAYGAHFMATLQNEGLLGG